MQYAYSIQINSDPELLVKFPNELVVKFPKCLPVISLIDDTYY